MAKIVLILGGARSGKSRFAAELAQRIGGEKVLFIATAEPRDPEMARRIDMHRRSRPADWDLLEQPSRVGEALEAVTERHEAVVLDCLTLLVANVLLEGDPEDAVEAEERVRAETNALLQACRRRAGTAVIVSDEVGQGIVPATPLGRIYRDLLGWTNQTVAAEAASVYLMVAGLPVEVKSLAKQQARRQDTVGFTDSAG